MSNTPLRYERLAKALPRHKHARDALLEAGFSPSTADKQAKRVLKSAVKYHAKALAKADSTQGLTSQQLMAELVGLSRSDVMDMLRKIATQDKDLASALKVLIPLAVQLGVNLDKDDKPVTVPILNIVVDKPVIDGTVVEAELSTPRETDIV